LDNCISCKNCVLCSNLRHKEYHILNTPYSREDYFKKLAQLELVTLDRVQEAQQRFAKFLAVQPRKHLQMEQVENSSGDYIRNAKNCFGVYHCYEAEDCSYGEHVWRGAKDCMDVHTAGRGAELIYESTNTNMGAYFSKFCRYCWGCRFVEYSNMCINSSHLFGCVGMKSGAKYCILNRQYSEKDYHEMVKRIVKQMRRDKEYGEFFPLSIALFGYNNTVSFDDYRMKREDVLAKGWKWEDEESGTRGKEDFVMELLPSRVAEADENICENVLTCDTCSRNYRLIKKEFSFYRQEQIPLPRCCPDCRHRARLGRRNAKKMSSVSCSRCEKVVITTLDPAKFENIVCDSCYRTLVY
jgi:hypothetical protein